MRFILFSCGQTRLAIRRGIYLKPLIGETSLE
jgi:hypothetical protein